MKVLLLTLKVEPAKVTLSFTLRVPVIVVLPVTLVLVSILVCSTVPEAPDNVSSPIYNVLPLPLI